MSQALFNPQEIIPAFDRHLGRKALTFTAIVIGGAALSVLGIITRHTRDLDLLDSDIPDEIRKSPVEFAKKHALSEDWLSCGPSGLAKDLPIGWRQRTQELFNGKSLKLSTLARTDLIGTKLYAMCDRMRDIEDLVALAPTDDELANAQAWVAPLDANPDWPAHVALNVKALRARLGRG